MTDLSTSAARFRDRMAELGHDIDVVALADSTRTAQEAATTLGCDVAQGYFISRPIEANALPDWVREWNTTGLPAT